MDVGGAGDGMLCMYVSVDNMPRHVLKKEQWLVQLSNCGCFTVLLCLRIRVSVIDYGLILLRNAFLAFFLSHKIGQS